MTFPRKRIPHLVKVWGCLVYAISGVANGTSERFDANLNKWATTTAHPEPFQIINAFPLNILDKYIYLINNNQGSI
jgi:hypothetical protein